MSNDYVIETQGLSKRFMGFTAVNNVNLRVREGTIHALIGPNGAGKTTCFNLITKFLAPSDGRIVYKGRDITRLKPAAVARLGMVRSFQISATFPHLSVRDNVKVALQAREGQSYRFWRPLKVLDRLNERADELLAAVGLSDAADELAVELSYGRKRALEVCTTLALKPEVMLLDEPTAGMGHEDVGRVVELIRRVAQGRTVLMVEHNLSIVSDLANRVTVLARGSVLAEGTYDEVSRNPDVLEAYIGAPA